MESNEKVRKVVKKELGIDKKRLVHSFKYAFSGIKQAYFGEQNLRIHIFMAILVIICGFLFHISYLRDFRPDLSHACFNG